MFNWVVYSYVLMINHYHLVLETRAATLSDGMHWLNFQYAQYVNRRYWIPWERALPALRVDH